ncbi:MAG: hypothetical protein KDB65_13665 [Calditrichaeota bacterium]|nr:hypothetical protein [Calditrichota bacterium]
MKEQTNVRSLRVLTLFVMAVSLFAFSQLFAASKKGEKKDVQTRLIYSGQFKGHVEPCG